MLKIKSRSNIKGHMSLKLYGADGKIKESRELDNTVTVLMDNHTAYRVANTGANVIGYMAVGTGDGSKTTASTGLTTSLSRVALDSMVATNNDVLFIATWAPGVGTGAIIEAGVIQGDNNTTLMLFNDFDVVNKGALDTIVINWTATFGAS
jgi:hypothetical protein